MQPTKLASSISGDVLEGLLFNRTFRVVLRPRFKHIVLGLLCSFCCSPDSCYLHVARLLDNHLLSHCLPLYEFLVDEHGWSCCYWWLFFGCVGLLLLLRLLRRADCLLFFGFLLRDCQLTMSSSAGASGSLGPKVSSKISILRPCLSRM